MQTDSHIEIVSFHQIVTMLTPYIGFSVIMNHCVKPNANNISVTL